MKYTELKKDLFSLPNDYMLVHCISADYALGAGIAKTFKAMGVRNTLLSCKGYGSLHPKGHFEGDGYCIVTKESEECSWKVANLVTKPRYYDKPSYRTLQDSLNDLKRILWDFPEVKKLGMPLIGCGLDRLEWSKVSELVKAIFADTDIEITVCHL